MKKFSLVLYVVLTACGAAPSSVSVPTPTTTTTTAASSTVTTSSVSSPTLKFTDTCTVSNSVTLVSGFSYPYSLAYVTNTYSNGSTTTSCKFTSLGLASAAGTCVLPVDSAGTYNDTAYSSVSGDVCHTNAVAASMVYNLHCNNPTSYAFQVQGYAPIGWSAQSPSGPIPTTGSSCTTQSFQ